MSRIKRKNRKRGERNEEVSSRADQSCTVGNELIIDRTI